MCCERSRSPQRATSRCRTGHQAGRPASQTLRSTAPRVARPRTSRVWQPAAVTARREKLSAARDPDAALLRQQQQQLAAQGGPAAAQPLSMRLQTSTAWQWPTVRAAMALRPGIAHAPASWRTAGTLQSAIFSVAAIPGACIPRFPLATAAATAAAAAAATTPAVAAAALQCRAGGRQATAPYCRGCTSNSGTSALAMRSRRIQARQPAWQRGRQAAAAAAATVKHLRRARSRCSSTACPSLCSQGKPSALWGRQVRLDAHQLQIMLCVRIASLALHDGCGLLSPQPATFSCELYCQRLLC